MFVNLKQELLENAIDQLYSDRFFPLDEEATIGIVSEAIDIAFQHIDNDELKALSEDYELDKSYSLEME